MVPLLIAGALLLLVKAARSRAGDSRALHVLAGQHLAIYGTYDAHADPHALFHVWREAWTPLGREFLSGKPAGVGRFRAVVLFHKNGTIEAGPLVDAPAGTIEITSFSRPSRGSASKYKVEAGGSTFL
jgi:hypothetical protein